MQLKTSNTIKFFEEGFYQRWDLLPYENDYDPAVFLGLYNESDVQAAIAHKGFKILVFTGADIGNYERLSHFNCISDQYNLHNAGIIPIKSYEDFKPTPLGEYIYIYCSTEAYGFHEKFKLQMAREVAEHFEGKLLIGYHGNSIDKLRKEYYNKSFINLQLNPNAGFTTALEMAHMGRKSISNYNADFCIPFSNTYDIVDSIKREQENIGKTRTLNIKLLNSSEWLTPKFWQQ